MKLTRAIKVLDRRLSYLLTEIEANPQRAIGWLWQEVKGLNAAIGCLTELHTALVDAQQSTNITFPNQRIARHENYPQPVPHLPGADSPGGGREGADCSGARQASCAERD